MSISHNLGNCLGDLTSDSAERDNGNRGRRGLLISAAPDPLSCFVRAAGEAQTEDSQSKWGKRCEKRLEYVWQLIIPVHRIQVRKVTVKY